MRIEFIEEKRFETHLACSKSTGFPAGLRYVAGDSRLPSSVHGKEKREDGVLVVGTESSRPGGPSWSLPGLPATHVAVVAGRFSGFA